MKTSWNTDRRISQITSNVVIIAAICFCLLLAYGACLTEVFAAQRGEDIKAGDVLDIKCGSWEEEYIVLNPTGTNTRAAGTLLLQKDVKDKTMFNPDDTDLDKQNFWDGSTAQSWCTAYYLNLPAKVRDAVVGVRTTETESGYKWFEINNIDGTQGDKDKVFFLSSKEYLMYKDDAIRPNDSAEGTEVGKWLLRSPGTDCSPDLRVYVAVVDTDGTARNYGAGGFQYGARPAFNISLPDDVCAEETENGTGTTWTLDMDNTDHAYGEPSYSWSDDMTQCIGMAVCDRCGDAITETVKVTETVTVEPTQDHEGTADCAAEFTDSRFETQHMEKTLPKKEAPAITAGTEFTSNGSVYRVISPASGTASLVKASNIKNVSVPATVSYAGRSFKITQVESKAFTGSKIRKVTIGKNVKSLRKKAFEKSRATSVVLKTALLKRSGIKKCLSGSAVKTVKVRVGGAKKNKAVLKKYRKIFTKKIAGRKVRLG